MDDISAKPSKRLKVDADLLESSSSRNSKDVKDCCHEEEGKPDQLELTASLSNVPNSIPDKLLEIETKYNELFGYLTFEKPVAYVYNPIEYAHQLHSIFIHKYCQSEKDILFLGMNPGPWGMSQTGVPFGDAFLVRNWFHITGPVGKPKRENPDRPIYGLLCQRTEPGDKRFWLALSDIFGKNPSAVCENIYVHNYCPLMFMTESGRNIIPPELKPEDRQELFRICDSLLVELLFLLNVKTIVAVGRFAANQCKLVIKEAQLNSVKLLCIPHPSSRNSKTHKTWRTETGKILKQLLPE